MTQSILRLSINCSESRQSEKESVRKVICVQEIMLPHYINFKSALPHNLYKNLFSLPFLYTSPPEAPTFPSRFHCDLCADVASAGSCHGCSPDVILFTPAKVRDAIEQHLWIGLILAGCLEHREHNIILANYDITVTRQGSWHLV